MWDWVLCIGGAAGLWLAGSKRRIGWALAFLIEAAWIPYGWATGQYGFIFGALLYMFVKGRNYRAWRSQ